MNTDNLNIKLIPTDDLIPYVNNPRLNDDAVDAVASSIAEFGWKVPCVITSDNIIITGHTRLKAAKKLGIEQIPCVIADDLSDAQIKAFRLADNKVGEIAEWDAERLGIELEGLDNMDMSLFGFDALGGEEPDIEDIVEDTPPEPPEEPKSKLGEIYKLGEHRLMCGDATSEDDMQALMGGELADLIITDPPYGVSVYNFDSVEDAKRENHRTDGLTVKNDDLRGDALYDMLSEAFAQMHDNMRDGASFYIWSSDTNRITFETALNSAGLSIRQILIWVKDRMVFGRRNYQWIHEPCLFGWKEGAAHYFIYDFTQTTVQEGKPVDYKKMKKDELVKILEEMQEYTTVIREKKPSVSILHPTMKPIKLIARLMLNSSQSGELVLDPFGGSGTTLIACEQTNRKCYMMELDPHYVDVIIERWETFTGRKAEKISE